MSKITQAAQGEDCTIRLGGICNRNPETVTFAHINGVRFGHGMGLKVTDLHGAFACSCCHDAVDGRTNTGLPKEFLKMAHYEGMIETQIKLAKKGLIKC